MWTTGLVKRTTVDVFHRHTQHSVIRAFVN